MTRVGCGGLQKEAHWITLGFKKATEERMQCLNVSLTRHHCYSAASVTEHQKHATATDTHLLHDGNGYCRIGYILYVLHPAFLGIPRLYTYTQQQNKKQREQNRFLFAMLFLIRPCQQHKVEKHARCKAVELHRDNE